MHKLRCYIVALHVKTTIFQLRGHIKTDCSRQEDKSLDFKITRQEANGRERESVCE